jgi:hypothetical protein
MMAPKAAIPATASHRPVIIIKKSKGDRLVTLLYLICKTRDDTLFRIAKLNCRSIR